MQTAAELPKAGVRIRPVRLNGDRGLQGRTQSLESGSRGIQISTGPIGVPASDMLVNRSNSGAFFSRRPEVASQWPNNQTQVSRSKAVSLT